MDIVWQRVPGWNQGRKCSGLGRGQLDDSQAGDHYFQGCWTSVFFDEEQIRNKYQVPITSPDSCFHVWFFEQRWCQLYTNRFKQISLYLHASKYSQVVSITEDLKLLKKITGTHISMCQQSVTALNAWHSMRHIVFWNKSDTTHYWKTILPTPFPWNLFRFS